MSCLKKKFLSQRLNYIIIRLVTQSDKRCDYAYHSSFENFPENGNLIKFSIRKVLFRTSCIANYFLLQLLVHIIQNEYTLAHLETTTSYLLGLQCHGIMNSGKNNSCIDRLYVEKAIGVGGGGF